MLVLHGVVALRLPYHAYRYDFETNPSGTFCPIVAV